jgi:hypothetical protein
VFVDMFALFQLLAFKNACDKDEFASMKMLIF